MRRDAWSGWVLRMSANGSSFPIPTAKSFTSVLWIATATWSLVLSIHRLVPDRPPEFEVLPQPRPRTREHRQPTDGTPLEAIPLTSRGFVHDVLSDADGISLHRFQMFIWTLVLGIIFVASVYKNLSMPEFSATLLGLMGISSGTYVGFKAQEKTAKDEPAATAPPPSP